MNLARFGVTKPVVINLLVWAILIGGVVSSFTITREFFPDVTPQMATIALPYPGARPEEVEDGLVIKVEDAIEDTVGEDISEMRTTIVEGGGGILVEFETGTDIEEAIDEIDRAIDSLTDLPEESENIEVIEFEARIPVILVTIYGDAAEEELKSAIHQVRDDLRSLPGMGEIALIGVRDYEIRVDVRSQALLEHGVSLPAVAAAIRAWMAEVPGGAVRTEGGNISVRTLGVPERARAIGDIVIRSSAEGAALRVSDIASVSESFVDEQLIRRFNSQPGASLVVYKKGDQDAVEMAEMVRAYCDGRSGRPFETRLLERVVDSPREQAYRLGVSSPTALPGEIATHSDLARFIEGRLDLLTRNALSGAIFVFLSLLIFLSWRAAVWVELGLVTAICGTLILMSVVGVTINLLTMFGLIIVIGMLVDDGIVVAENIETRHREGEPALQAAIGGTQQVLWPVVATVVTTIVAFLPLTFIEGQIGDLLGALPMVVACALSVSLVEALLILPAHMGHSLKKRDRFLARLGATEQPSGFARFRASAPEAMRRFERWRDFYITERVAPAFGRLLDLSLRFRYISISIALATLLISFGLLAGGRVGFTFLDSADSETIIVDVRLPVGSTIDETLGVVKIVEEAALAQNERNGREVKSVSSMIGETQNLESGARDVAASHVAQLFIELEEIESRGRTSEAIIASIRAATGGRVAAAETIRYSEVTGGPGGADFTVELHGADFAAVEAASMDLQQQLASVPGVHDVADDNYAGQREIQITLRPGAAALGFTVNDVATQVRGALYGIEAHVFAAEREDIDVRVRLDEATRGDLAAIENLWIISPAGKPVPIVEVAELREGTSYATLRRIDRARAITVTADASPGTNPEDVVRAFPWDELRARHPGVRIDFGGRQRNLTEALATLPYGFLAALVLIYVNLAWLFSSYTQPLAVMMAIPFGLIGVIWGHFLMGYTLTFLSLIGFVALSGVVVNDSLILVEYYNVLRSEGLTIRNALVKAGARRLRPIFLTTITTVLGLMPLVLEQSFQARFLIPMAIAICWGLVSSTILVLMVLPCIIVVIDDVKGAAYFLWHGESRAEKAARDSKRSA
jgi:multidrug efflux pump subunit AcrB